MKKIVFLLMVILGGCSFFDPEPVVDHERLALQYEAELRKLDELGYPVNKKIVKSVKSHECKFLKYEEPDFKADAIFKCKLVLESSSNKDYTDDVILKRYGMEEGKSVILEQSLFLTGVADESYKASLKTNTP